MRYQLQQKLLALGDDFHIRNEEGRDVYYVDGKAFSVGKQLSFQDMEGRQIAFISQKVFRLRPTYEIWIDGEQRAVVTKELFTFFRCRFLIDVPGPDDIEAEGDFLDHEYRFMRGDRTIATVSRRWFSLRDTYGVDVQDDVDAVAVLCGAIVIDLMCHNGRRR